MNSKEKVIHLLKERHQNYLGTQKEKLEQDPNWVLNNPLKGNEFEEWIEYGVNTIMSEMNISREKAEIEMSWIEGGYGTLIR